MTKNYDLTIVKQGDVYQIPVHCERKKRKTLVLRVYPKTAKVLFSIPLRTPAAYAEKFFESNKSWLTKQLEKILPLKQSHTYENGDKFYLFGKQLEFVTTSGRKNYVYVDEQKLVCEQKQPDKEKRKQLVEKFFQQQFDRFLQNHYAHIYDKYNSFLGIAQLPTLKTRKMTSKWGICRPKRQEITLSKRLVHVASEFIEYVLVHELCHFVYLDHSPAYWRLLQKLMPDCKERRQELNAQQDQVEL